VSTSQYAPERRNNDIANANTSGGQRGMPSPPGLAIRGNSDAKCSRIVNGVALLMGR
jgi:hypothetical protein